jgi:D-inositol-3-phosphate glycosyltransferase
MPSSSVVNPKTEIQNQKRAVALLTGGGDRPYVFGLVTALIPHGVALDVIGSDDLEIPGLSRNSAVNFLNLRGSHRSDAGIAEKVFRVLRYYARLIRYSVTAKPRIFHILWNNKFEAFDRTLLMLYYRLLGKKVVFTAHNVNAGRRDGVDTVLNRVTLRIQYRLAHHIFVHTEKMRRELVKDFGVTARRVSVIPFGINNAVPITYLSTADARQRLGIRNGKRTMLFFGRIAPAKGLEYLIAAFRQLLARRDDYQLIIAGRPDRCEKYWTMIREAIHQDVERGSILLRAEFIPDEETEIYFKAADVLVLPYRHIYQSGVLFLSYSFGLPVVAADVGSLRDDIIEGQTGFLCRPCDTVSLAENIERYFASDLFKGLANRRREIRDYAIQQHSWGLVAEKTRDAYTALQRNL